MRVPISWLSKYLKLPQKLSVLTDKFTMVGHMLDKIDVVNGNTVIDLELRGNRADLVGIVGIAKEASAVLETKYKEPDVAKLPKTDKGSSLIKILPEVGNLVKRYQAVKISVEIKESPKFIKERLQEYGIPTFNNVIDITNYVMVETGHPMHAFDVGKLAGKKLIVRMAKKGEKFETIQQGTTLTLSDQDLAIADEKGVQCLNIIGGFDSRVTETTKEIILESAVYDPGNCRRTGRRLKTLTEGGNRHEKLQDPNGVTFALERALFLLQKYASGKTISLVSDYYPKLVKPWKIDLNYEYLCSLSGVKIPSATVKNILASLGFSIIKNSKEKISTLVPTYRTDVTLEEDLIEEIVRIYGYDKIPTKTLSLEIPKNVTPDYIYQEDNIRSNATSIGFDEIISLSFVKENLENYNLHPESLGKKVVNLINPPSPDNKNLRITLIPNLYEATIKAVNEREEEVRLFEIGKVYLKQNEKYQEERKIGFIYYGKTDEGFKNFKSFINGFLNKSNLPPITYANDATNLPLSQSYRLELNKKTIGFGGTIQKIFYYLELDLDSLLGREQKYVVNLWPKYPPQIEDHTFTFPEKTKIGEAISAIKLVDKQIVQVDLIDIYEDSYTIRIRYQNPTKTLTDSEVEEVRNQVLKVIKEKFGGSLKN